MRESNPLDTAYETVPGPSGTRGDECPRMDSNHDASGRSRSPEAIGSRAWSSRQESNLDRRNRNPLPGKPPGREGET